MARTKTIMVDGERFKAMKYDLYNGYELVYANHRSLYSITISDEEAFKRFGGDFLKKVCDNSEMFVSPYYGERKRWLETPFYN